MCATPDLDLLPLQRAWHVAAQRDDDARYQHRLLAVLLVAQHHSCMHVGAWLACSPRSIERWVSAYRSGGCAALHMLRAGGRPARLTAIQQMRLSADLAGPPSAVGLVQTGWCGKLLVTHLSRSYGLALSLRQCQRMIRQSHLEHGETAAMRQGLRRYEG